MTPHAHALIFGATTILAAAVVAATCICAALRDGTLRR